MVSDERSVMLIFSKGDVFDVSGKETYAPGKGYHGSSNFNLLEDYFSIDVLLSFCRQGAKQGVGSVLAQT
jgi:hypothetical protein